MSPESVIDLRSDTVTRPTLAMRDSMRAATVGDDVYEEAPTVLGGGTLQAGILAAHLDVSSKGVQVAAERLIDAIRSLREPAS